MRGKVSIWTALYWKKGHEHQSGYCYNIEIGDRSGPPLTKELVTKLAKKAIKTNRNLRGYALRGIFHGCRENWGL